MGAVAATACGGWSLIRTLSKVGGDIISFLHQHLSHSAIGWLVFILLTIAIWSCIKTVQAHGIVALLVIIGVVALVAIVLSMLD